MVYFLFHYFACVGFTSFYNTTTLINKYFIWRVCLNGALSYFFFYAAFSFFIVESYLIENSNPRITMSEMNPFVLPSEQYVRKLDPLNVYVKDTTTYLQMMTGKPAEVCEAFVRKQLRTGGRFEFKPPVATYTERQENGDRVIKQDTIYNFIKYAIDSKDLIAPTFTTYTNPKVKTSLLVGYIDGNISRRKVAKKAMFKADKDGDLVVYAIKKNEQNNRKLGNNAISGSHVSPFTPLYNKTAHSTLTSNCRTTSGYGNANNEKMLSGNRHYHESEVVQNNIISIINVTNMAAFSAMMEKYKFHYPTPDETMAVITYSTDLYWKNKPKKMERIRHLVTQCSPVQRAAFVYVGDFFHFTKFNQEFVRTFIGSIIKRCHAEIDDPDKVIRNLPEDNFILAKQIINNDLRGVKDEDLKGTRLHQEMAATTMNVTTVAMGYSDLIKCLFVTDNMPASLAYFPDSIRRSALTSDTDSTIFTVQDWVKWYCGKYTFSDEGMGVAATMIWLSSQTIIHLLAKMSANYGIGKERIHQIAMKNEYKFDVFVPTSVAKHYFALIGCQEGELKASYGKEIKGVHLKSSNAPVHITKKGEEMMLEIMNTVLSEKKISITKYLKHVADIERQIFAELKQGHPKYFRRSQIKNADAYTKGPMQSNYLHYSMWQEVFAEKYGDVPEPPYDVIKISVDNANPTKMGEWLRNMPDQDIANRLRTFMQKYNKTIIKTFYLPQVIVKTRGIPEEVHLHMASRNMVRDMTKIFKLILQTLGYYVNEEFLLSDMY